MKKIILISFIFVLTGLITAEKITPEFDSQFWDLSAARIVDHLNRKAVEGRALLKNLSVKNGIINVDIATTRGNRSYPGVLFRMRDTSNYERFYIRPHRSPFYDDVLQYGPVFNGVDSWQLYYGPGLTAAMDITPDQWNRLKIIFAGDQARVFWNRELKPVLIVRNLAHGDSGGAIGLVGPLDGTAFFSNFSCESNEDLSLPQLPPPDLTPGIISGWKISGPFGLTGSDFTKYPHEWVKNSTWTETVTDHRGFVDISRYCPRKSRAGDMVLAKTVIQSDSESFMRVGFGYSDFITVFLNGRPVFFGNSAYRSRDKSFLGILGYNDNLFLPLKKGDNELLLMVGESMGGWGFCFRREDDIYMDPSIKEEWKSKTGFALPEAVIYDPDNDVCYVSNYFNEGKEFISRVSLRGDILDREWINGLRMPTGMAVRENTLYVIDRGGINLIDIKKGEIRLKIALPDARMPNDIGIDSKGNIFVSDLPGNSVFLYCNGKAERWLENLDGPNALFAEKGRLLVGQNEKLLAVDYKTKSISVIAEFEPGSNIDGIQPDGCNGYYISDYKGKLYHLKADGSRITLLNTSNPGDKIADFIFIKKHRLFILPTFDANSLTAYRIE